MLEKRPKPEGIDFEKETERMFLKNPEDKITEEYIKM